MVKRILFFVAILTLGFSQKANAQCAFNNTYMGTLNPTGVGAGNAATTACAFGGDYYGVTVCAGASYTFSTCGTSGFDSQLTVYDASGTFVQGYNDDGCSQQSTITWTATFSGTAYVLIDQYNCQSNSTCQQLTVTQNTACPAIGSANDCGSAIAAVCGSSFTNQTTLNAGNDRSSYACHLDGLGVPITTNGSDMVYAVTVPAGQTTMVVQISNVIDGNDTYLELISAGTNCAAGCSNSIQYNIAQAQFTNGTGTASFSTVGPGVFYFWVDSQNDGIYNYNISFNCVSSGIFFDNNSNCGGATGDAADGDLNGLLPSVNGSTTAASRNLVPCQTYTICETFYIENPTNWEWLDQVTMNLGNCYTAVTPNNNMAGSFQGGTWVSAYTVGTNTIDWDFNHNAPNTTWGDGSGGNFNCQTYTNKFCFTTTISAGCTQAEMVIGIIAQDDGVGSTGSTVVGTTVAAEDNLLRVNETVPPTINCPAPAVFPLDPGVCSVTLPDLTSFITATDNCGTPTITQITPVGTVFGVGPQVVQFLATDLSGNTATCNWNITVTDVTVPTITCPGNYSANVAAGACNASVVTANPTFVDDCAAVSVTWAMTGATVANSPGTGINYVGTYSFNSGVTTVTYTGTDPSGNTAVCSFTVTITDNINPTVTCPANIAANTGAGTCTASVVNPNPVRADNCAVIIQTWAMTGATVASSAAAGINNVGTQTFNLGVTTVTYTVTDAAGNTATCSYTVTVTDNINPTVTCPANISQNVGAGTCTASVVNPNPTTGDNCSIASLTWAMTGATVASSPGAGINNVGTQTFNLGVTTVTYTITDGSGRTATCSYTVTVTDNINPTVTCPANISQNVGAGTCTASVVNPNAVTADNCSVATLTWAMTGATVASSPAAGINNVGTQTFNLGVTTVTYTVTDGSGRTATCSYTVTVTDNIPPTITCPANIAANTGAGTCTASVVNPNATTGDNCSIATLTWALTGATVASSPAAGINNVGTRPFNLGVTTVTYTITDGSGLTATCSYTVTVTDNINPTVTCPANIAANTGAGTCTASVVNPNPTTADNCSVATLTWAMTGATVASSPAAGINNVGTQTFNLGVTTVTYTVTDGSGRTATCSYTVTVTDNIAPSITCPANQNVSANASCQFVMANYTGMATTSDNCVGAVTVTQSPLAGATVSGTQVVTLTATDAAGNTATCTFSVIVTDNTPPTITCPANQTGNANASCQFALLNYTGLATKSDNCTATGSITVTQSPVTGTLVGLGVTVVTLTATDANGNSSTCTFNVTVSDVTAPTVTCPANQNLPVNASCAATLPNYIPMVTVSDNCSAAGSITVTQSPVAGTALSGAGTVQVVTITATDAVGNSSTCTFNVTLTDTSVPVIVGCPANQNVSANGACQFVMADYTSTITVTDNCAAPGLITITQSPLAGATVSGTQNVTLTVTDPSGNISTCTFQVIVADNTAPTLTCPAAQTGNTNASCQFALLNYTSMATVTDNCTASGSITVTQSPVAGTLVGVGTTVVTLTASDANGNSTTCTFNVVVTDNSVPVFAVCPPAQNLNISSACDAVVPDYTSSATVTDDCGTSGTITVTQSPVAGTVISGAGTVQAVTLTATDPAGNSSTCTFNITITDVTVPVIVGCPANQNVSANGACQFVMADYTSTITVSDNCAAPGLITITQSPLAGATVSGTQTVTLTVTDPSGNVSTCSFQVIVADNTPPTVTCPVTQSGTTDASCQFTLLDYTSMATVSDNCSAAGSITITQSPVAGTIVGLGTTVVTLTVSDANGNTTTCTFDVDVTDTSVPVFAVCPSAQNLNITSACDAVVPDYTSSATVTDNCGTSGTITVTQSPLAGTTISGAGTVQVVTLTATDPDGNVSTCNFNITITDITAPSITCPADQTEAPDVNCQFTLIDYTSLATTSDNCSAVTVTQSPAVGTVITGNTTITLTATDASGNTSTCTFQVLLADSTPPAIVNCPATQNEVSDGTCQFTVPDYTSSITTTDNCGSSTVVVTQSPTAGTVVGTGTTTVTVTATDGGGNVATCTFDIVVADTTAPVINCPANITTCNPVVTFAAPTTSDNCAGSVTVTQTDVTGLSSGSTFPVGTTTLQFTATDASGNTSVCSFDVIVEPTPSPAVAGSDLTLCDSVSAVVLTATAPAVGTGTWALLSGGGTFSSTTTPITTLSGIPVGTTQVIWTVSSGSCTPNADTLNIDMTVCFDIIIPTGFTPDGDGTNDVWDIPYLNLYHPNCRVEVYNRWGGKLFESDGYATPWDGTYNGQNMPVASYYFVINYNDGSTEPIKGTVTIIR